MLGLVQLLLPFFVAVQGYTECQWGLHGKHCNLTCPQNCALLPPLDIPYCDTDTGKCSEGCQRGWHGDLCNQDCSRNCLNTTCNHQTGHCTHGCSGNNAGHFCNDTRDCGRGWYGDLCQHPCSINCLEDRCHHTTGVCILGCSGTYTGEFCNTTKVVNNKEDSNSLTDKQVAVALNVATVVGVTVTITVSVIVYLRLRGRRKNSSRSPEAESSEVESSMITDDLHKEEPPMYSGDLIEDWEVVSMKISNNYRKVKNTLKSYGRVSMSGAPGGGKTDLALTLGTKYRDKGYQVVSVNDVLKFNLQHYVNQGKDMCFIFLDVFKTVKLPKHTALLQRLLHELQSHLEKHNSDNEQKLYAIFTTNSYSDTGQIPPLGEVGDYFFSGPPFINFNVEFHG